MQAKLLGMRGAFGVIFHHHIAVLDEGIGQVDCAANTRRQDRDARGVRGQIYNPIAVAVAELSSGTGMRSTLRFGSSLNSSIRSHI